MGKIQRFIICDREWIERGEERDATGGSLFASWPRLVPQLADFGSQVP